MADRKLLTLKHIVVWLTWGGLVAAHLTVLLLIDKSIEDYTVLVIALFAILVSIFCAAALVVYYRCFFGQWRGVIALFVALVLTRWLATRDLSPSLGLIVSTVAIDIMLVLGVSLTLVLYRRDDGLPLIGWVLAGFVWMLVIANRVQGDLVKALLNSINDPSDYSLWWLDSLWCFLWWSVPLGALSFLWHTLRFIVKEVRGEVLDSQAWVEYKQRLRELAEERQQATEAHDEAALMRRRSRLS